MREFSGCETDCGSAETKSVTVNFFDPWKLQAAYDTLENAKNEGWNSGDGNGKLEASKYTGSDTTPIAGWNICSRNLKEEGFFEPVCMFDGDVFVDGLPYRTDELEDGGDSFGGSLTFDLFGGIWELRLAFTGFSWSYDDVEVPIAFPAVRGNICIEQQDDDGGSEHHCETWDPCAAARNCSCEWTTDGTYYCFEPQYFENWQSEMYSYVKNQDLVYVADWLGINDTYTPTVSLNTSQLEDDQWTISSCDGSGTHTLTLYVTNATDGYSNG